MYHQINTKISDCPERVSIAQCSENWYVKPQALGSIHGWGSQTTFRNRQRFDLNRIFSLYLQYSLYAPEGQPETILKDYLHSMFNHEFRET